MLNKKKFFLIGGNGFVGRHFQEIYAKDFLIKVFDKNDNVLNYKNLKDSLLNYFPDYVINLASYSTINSAKTFENDLFDLCIHGNINIIQALTEINFQGSYLYVSSAEVYGYSNNNSFREDNLLNPLNEYAVAKVMAEVLLKFKSYNSFFKIQVARPFNHFGKNQSTNFFLLKLLHNIANQINNQKKKIVLQVGNKTAKRSFLHVDDVCAAYVEILKNKNIEQFSIFNVCHKDSYSIPDLIEPLLKEKNIVFEYSKENNFFSDNTLMGNNLKLTELGWKPKKNIINSLRLILDDLLC